MADETPLVHRSVRTGGILLAIAAAQFAVVTALVTSRFPGYSWTGTRVTELASAPSPWGLAFAASLVALGAVALFGLLLTWTAFDGRPARGVSLLLLIVGAVAAMALGATTLLPSLAWGPTAKDAVYVATLAVGGGLVVLPTAMHRQERWRASRAYTLASGLVILATAALYGLGLSFGVGPGGLQTIGLGAAVLWPIVEGTHIALLHRFAPGLHVKVAAA